MKAYAVYYRFYAEAVEQRELQDIYLKREAADSHNTMSDEELAWSGITSVDVEEVEIIE